MNDSEYDFMIVVRYNDVRDCVGLPTDSKQCSNGYDHQGNSFAHFHDTLCVKKKHARIRYKQLNPRRGVKGATENKKYTGGSAPRSKPLALSYTTFEQKARPFRMPSIENATPLEIRSYIRIPTEWVLHRFSLFYLDLSNTVYFFAIGMDQPTIRRAPHLRHGQKNGPEKAFTDN